MTAVTPKPVNIMDAAAFVTVSLSRLWTRKKVQTSAVGEMEADKSMIHVSKDILESPELQAISHLDGEIRRYLWDQQVPASPLGGGFYLIPLDVLPKVMGKMKAFEAQRDELVAVFVKAYPKKIEEAKEKLKDLFDPDDYPKASKLAASFDMTVRVFSFTTPEKLKGIDSALYEEAKQQAEAMWKDAATEIRDALRESMAGLVGHLVDKLAGGEDGKAKRFKESSVVKFNEFLESFNSKNLAGDKALADLVQKARKVMSGVDAKGLRADEGIRTAVIKGFEPIKKALEKMIEVKPTRKIHLED